MEGQCFDCGKVVPRIHKHHPCRSDPGTMSLCPSCHIQRHKAHEGTIPITQYLSEEQLEIVFSNDEQEEAELEALELKAEQHRAKIRDKYTLRRLRLIRKLIGDVPNYTLINYPYPIWNLHFFKYLQPTY